MTSASPILPAEALARWLARDPDPKPPASWVARVIAWIARLQARMLVSGGRLGELLIELGSCTVEDLLGCVHAQLDAGPLGEGQLAHDLRADLFVVRRHASLAELERLSARLASTRGEGVDELHVALAERWLAAGDEAAAERVLARVEWHLPLLRLLEGHAAELSPQLRERLAARTIALLERSGLEPEFHVGILCSLAVITTQSRWLARAEAIVASLPSERLECSPDYAHPIEDLAWAQAELGDLAGGLARVRTLEPAVRWSGLLRLLPRVPTGASRSALLDELFDLVEPAETSWLWLVELAPELGERVYAQLVALADEDQRFDELGAALRHLPPERAREACAWMLAHARALEPGTRRWWDAWDVLLEGLVEVGEGDLLDDAARRRLLDDALADGRHDSRDELARGSSLGHFVPADRVADLLAEAIRRLDAADHYLDRCAWLELGATLVERAPAELRERWWSTAIAAKIGTPIERSSDLVGFSLEQQRAIVLGRLDQHQREFLPRQILGTWVIGLAWSLPSALVDRVPAALAWIPADVRARQRSKEVPAIERVVDPAERARIERELAERLDARAWPSHECLREVFESLAALEGESALAEALEALATSTLDWAGT